MNKIRKKNAGQVVGPRKDVPAKPRLDQLSEADQALVDKVKERRRARARPPRLKASHEPPGPIVIQYDNTRSEIEAYKLLAAFGTTDEGLAHHFLGQLANAACEGSAQKPLDTASLDAAVATMSAIGPRDEIESMLVAQMIATHAAVMTQFRRLKGVQNLAQLKSNGSLVNRLLRAYAAQVEALQRYRGKGQQKVTVEHVHVHEGGQAIVGAVNTRGV